MKKKKMSAIDIKLEVQFEKSRKLYRPYKRKIDAIDKKLFEDGERHGITDLYGKLWTKRDKIEKEYFKKIKPINKKIDTLFKKVK